MPQDVVQQITDALPEWDDFVRSHPDGTIYHLNGWRRALEASFPHISGHLLIIRDIRTGQIQAGLPICHVQSRLLGNRWVSIPFAPFCDPLTTSDGNRDMLIKAAIEQHALSSSDYIQLRFIKPGPADSQFGFSESRFYKYHRLSLDKDLQTLRQNVHADAVRRMLNRAERKGVTISPASGMSDMSAFYSLFLQQRQQLGLPPIPRLFFESLWKAFSPGDLVSFHLARFESRVVGASFGFRFNGLAMPEFLVVDPEYRSQGVTQALYWHGITEACQENCRYYGFGRTAESTKGLMRFKQRWNTEQLDILESFYPAAKNAVLHEKEKSGAYRVISTMARVSPPLVRKLLGNFCYRHMG
jgi:CelD/BcsL family acetyltransferase involved in cellulose biosynthesis